MIRLYITMLLCLLAACQSRSDQDHKRDMAWTKACSDVMITRRDSLGRISGQYQTCADLKVGENTILVAPNVPLDSVYIILQDIPYAAKPQRIIFYNGKVTIERPDSTGRYLTSGKEPLIYHITPR